MDYLLEPQNARSALREGVHLVYFLLLGFDGVTVGVQKSWYQPLCSSKKTHEQEILTTHEIPETTFKPKVKRRLNELLKNKLKFSVSEARKLGPESVKVRSFRL